MTGARWQGAGRGAAVGAAASACCCWAPTRRRAACVGAAVRSRAAPLTGSTWRPLVCCSIVAKGSYSEKDAATLIRDMVRVVAHCHGLGVMHRCVAGLPALQGRVWGCRAGLPLLRLWLWLCLPSPVSLLRRAAAAAATPCQGSPSAHPAGTSSPRTSCWPARRTTPPSSAPTLGCRCSSSRARSSGRWWAQVGGRAGGAVWCAARVASLAHEGFIPRCRKPVAKESADIWGSCGRACAAAGMCYGSLP